jgi:hypothetical protein
LAAGIDTGNHTPGACGGSHIVIDSCFDDVLTVLNVFRPARVVCFPLGAYCVSSRRKGGHWHHAEQEQRYDRERHEPFHCRFHCESSPFLILGILAG